MTPSPSLREQPLGKVRVASEVVASIAAMAAMETPGVVAMCEPAGVPVPRPLRGPHGHRGVRLEMVGSAAIKIELYLSVDAEAALPELTEELQGRVSEDIHKMLGLEVVEINVHVVRLEAG